MSCQCTTADQCLGQCQAVKNYLWVISGSELLEHASLELRDVISAILSLPQPLREQELLRLWPSISSALREAQLKACQREMEYLREATAALQTARFLQQP